MLFEFVIFTADDDGDIHETGREVEERLTVKSAKARAAALAKKSRGPVDIAYAEGGDWNTRYITTAIVTRLDAIAERTTNKLWHYVTTFERLD